MKNIKLSTKHLEKLDESLYSYQKSSPLINPKLVSVNREFAHNLGFTNKQIDSQDFVDFVNGSLISDDSKTYANAYGGHQFGYQVEHLGDGRALNLGKLNNQHLQLKGSGITPYSRGGDGRAVLRSSIREYLLSEAMHGLGISTTRALAIIDSDTTVYRSYDVESASIVLRVSPSWIRFGSFEFAYNSKNQVENLKKLADFVIDESYPALKNMENKYEELYFEIVDKTIELIALWQSVGFMHGVMNTDNMSIDGLTIDYGPYAFMEQFDKSFICNLSDKEGRYSFENQPFVAQWNLYVLAKVFSPIVNEEILKSYNNTFIGRFKDRYFQIMKQKLGLFKSFDDNKLILNLFNIMENEKIDYTSFFHNLSYERFDDIDGCEIVKWIDDYKNRLMLEDKSVKDRLEFMQKINPKYILRNYMIQDAIDLAQNGDYTLVNNFLKIAQNPFGEHKEFEQYTKPNEDFTALKCSCSS